MELAFYSCLSIEGNQRHGDASARLEQQLKTLTDQISDVQAKVAEIIITPQAGDDTWLDGSDQQQRRRHMDAHVTAAKAFFSDASIYNESIAGTLVGDTADVADLAATFGSIIGLNDDQKNRIREWIPHEEMIDGIMRLPYRS
jgi:hypothetical protein